MFLQDPVRNPIKQKSIQLKQVFFNLSTIPYNPQKCTFLTIISAVVRQSLIERSTTGKIRSCTALSTAGRMHCFRWGYCWNKTI